MGLKLGQVREETLAVLQKRQQKADEAMAQALQSDTVATEEVAPAPSDQQGQQGQQEGEPALGSEEGDVPPPEGQ